MQTKKRSPLTAIVLAVVIGLMVIALLNGVIRPTQVVVAKVAIAPGTLLTEDYVELRTIPMGAKPADAAAKVEDAAGKMLAVGRAPGDMIVKRVLGEIAGAGIPAELPEGHVAMAISRGSGQRRGRAAAPRADGDRDRHALARDPAQDNPSQRDCRPRSPNSAAAWLHHDPALSLATPTPTPTPAPPSAPLARLAITGLRVLMVPQSFRYEEVPAGASEEQLILSARTSMSAQEGSVIVLDVPTQQIEVTPGFKTDPATLLAALDQYGLIHLALEPASGLGLDVSDVVTLNLGELYEEMNDNA